MSSGSKYTLQRTMIVYFLLIGFASLMVSIEFIVETHSVKFQHELSANLKQYSEGGLDAQSVFAPIDKLKKKAILMIAIILAVIMIVLTMFIRNITEPLQHIIDLSRKISHGDLSRTISIRSENELAELGNVINEITGNLQEITMLSKNLCESGAEITEKASSLLSQPDFGEAERAMLESEIKNLKTEFDTVSNMIEYFNFYKVEPHES